MVPFIVTKFFENNKKSQNSASRINEEGRIPATIRKNCLHSQIIYGDSVDTFDPYYRGYMKVLHISLFNCNNRLKTRSSGSFFN